MRRPLVTWGATRDEEAARLPGDEVLECVAGVATRRAERLAYAGS
jgi:hypothetical protein